MHLEFWTAPRDSFLFCLSSRPFFYITLPDRSVDPSPEMLLLPFVYYRYVCYVCFFFSKQLMYIDRYTTTFENAVLFSVSSCECAISLGTIRDDLDNDKKPTTHPSPKQGKLPAPNHQTESGKHTVLDGCWRSRLWASLF